MSNDLTNGIIAGASVGNVVVYFLLWRQTKALFLEAHQPALSVGITACWYDAQTETFNGQIEIANRGAVAANNVNFRIRFGAVGFNFTRDIGPIVIQPQTLLTWPMTCGMKHDTYRVTDSEGNRLWAVAEGTYRGTAKTFGYSEHHEYYHVLNRFVPKWSTVQPAQVSFLAATAASAKRLRLAFRRFMAR